MLKPTYRKNASEKINYFLQKFESRQFFAHFLRINVHFLRCWGSVAIVSCLLLIQFNSIPSAQNGNAIKQL